MILDIAAAVVSVVALVVARWASHETRQCRLRAEAAAERAEWAAARVRAAADEAQRIRSAATRSGP